MAGWHDTIDVMIRLQEWWGSREGVLYGDGFIESIESANFAMAGGLQTRQQGWLSNVARNQIEAAEPFFVSPNVFEMIDKAAAQFNPEPFQATDLITPSGFVLLPRSFYVKDRHGQTNGCRAFSWGPCRSSGPKTNLAFADTGATSGIRSSGCIAKSGSRPISRGRKTSPSRPPTFESGRSTDE